MPRLILAPIFFVWFGLGVASKVAIGVTLVFFIVFFNVYPGSARGEPGGARQHPHARRIAAPAAAPRVSGPSAMSWCSPSLHNSVGLAFVGAVVGEYLGSSEASAT